ncbi:RING finger protein [Armadillidium nasatum]|uniref:RING finger protein n=1 Tax=Armadillidium nasatum TaxID=96803 RepID=A0A5N5TNW2_9CRUS|nr:RING finger protein [Armadillidium nasatum]
MNKIAIESVHTQSFLFRINALQTNTERLGNAIDQELAVLALVTSLASFSLLFIALPSLKLITSSRTEGQRTERVAETLLGIVGGVLSLLALIKLFLEFQNMDVPLLNCGSTCFFNWKTLSTKIIMGTKRNLLRMEKIYLDMKNFSVLINQELIEREDWSMYVHVARGSNVRHLAMSATKIVLEWTKAITFIITVVFILLVFGLEKGLKNYSPGVPYLVVTGVYYILSEKVFVDLICKIVDMMKFECFESMESLYLPLILKGIQIILSFIFTIICFLLGHIRITFLSCFTNLRVRYMELDNNHWQPLVCELVRLMQFRSANKEEIMELDDVCAICLQPMKTARITPCRHFFHADCLRRCLKQATNQSCPICKQDLSSFVN